MEHKAHEDDPFTASGHTITLYKKDIKHLLTISHTAFNEAISAYPDRTFVFRNSAFKYLFGQSHIHHVSQPPSAHQHSERTKGLFTKRLGFSLAQWPRVTALIARSQHVLAPKDRKTRPWHFLQQDLRRAEKGLVALFIFASSMMTNRVQTRHILDKIGQSLPDEMIRIILERNNLPYHTPEELRQGGLPCIIANNPRMAKAYLRISELHSFILYGSFIKNYFESQHTGFSKLMPQRELEDAAKALWNCDWQHEDLVCLLGRDITFTKAMLSYFTLHLKPAPDTAHPIDTVLFLTKFHQSAQNNRFNYPLAISSIEAGEWVLKGHVNQRTQGETKLLVDAAEHFIGETPIVPSVVLRHLSPAEYRKRSLMPTMMTLSLSILLLILLHLTLYAIWPTFTLPANCNDIPSRILILAFFYPLTLAAAVHFMAAPTTPYHDTVNDRLAITIQIAIIILSTLFTVISGVNLFSSPLSTALLGQVQMIVTALPVRLIVEVICDKSSSSCYGINFRAFPLSTTPTRDIQRHRSTSNRTNESPMT